MATFDEIYEVLVQARKESKQTTFENLPFEKFKDLTPQDFYFAEKMNFALNNLSRTKDLTDEQRCNGAIRYAADQDLQEECAKQSGYTLLLKAAKAETPTDDEIYERVKNSKVPNATGLYYPANEKAADMYLAIIELTSAGLNEDQIKKGALLLANNPENYYHRVDGKMDPTGRERLINAAQGRRYSI